MPGIGLYQELPDGTKSRNFSKLFIPGPSWAEIKVFLKRARCKEALNMFRSRFGWICRLLVGPGLVLLANAGTGRADDNNEELRKLVEEQGKQIQELKKKLDTS